MFQEEQKERKKIMKKIVAIVSILTICLICAVGCAKTADNTYTLTNCEVYDVGKYEGEIAIADPTMDIWVWREPVGDVAIGDKCELLMDNNGTPDYLYDDKIVEIYWEEEG